MEKPKVLYVEDEPALGRIVRESLESRNFEVIMVTDGGQAFQSFVDSNPDICILDVMLPNLDGYAIAKKIRERSSTVPIIFVTAKTQTDDVVKGFELGGNDYVRKPFSMEELIVRINNLLSFVNRSTDPKAEIIPIGKLEFNISRYELNGPGGSRKLSHREALLLKILTENKNATVSRKDILMRIWGDDSFFNSRNLDVYITKLRDYLKDDKNIEIITIKGVGYHFAVTRDS